MAFGPERKRAALRLGRYKVGLAAAVPLVTSLRWIIEAAILRMFLQSFEAVRESL